MTYKRDCVAIFAHWKWLFLMECLHSMPWLSHIWGGCNRFCNGCLKLFRGCLTFDGDCYAFCGGCHTFFGGSHTFCGYFGAFWSDIRTVWVQFSRIYRDEYHRLYGEYYFDTCISKHRILCQSYLWLWQLLGALFFAKFMSNGRSAWCGRAVLAPKVNSDFMTILLFTINAQRDRRRLPLKGFPEWGILKMVYREENAKGFVASGEFSLWNM